MATKHESVMNALDIRKAELEIESLELSVASDRRVSESIMARAEHHGEFSFVGPVMEGYVHQSIRELESYSRQHPGAPIKILLNSEGGNVLDGLAYVDYLRLLKKRGHHLTIMGVGIVASMAGAILAVANERVITSRCWIGLHEVSGMVAGSLTQQEDKSKFMKQLQDQIVELMCERSTLTPVTLKNRWKRKDIFLNAEESLKLGLVDRVEEV